jgi:PAS domain S-box-containing protein
MAQMNNMNAEKNRRILIVDDNHAIHDDFRKILVSDTIMTATLDASEEALFGSPTTAVQHAQYEVESAYQGQEGVLLVKKALEAGRPYALAFVDVRMPPGWDGVETTQRIWAVDPDIQIVICTAYSDYSWNEMFEKIGNCDGLVILKKPFDMVEVLQLAHALTEKWSLRQQSRLKMYDMECMIAERTRELQQSNQTLQAEVIEHMRAKAELEWKTAFLEAQVNSSIDGILVVDVQGEKTLQNQRLTDLLKIPEHITDDKDDEQQLRWVTEIVKTPEQFTERVAYLNSHPDEISRDEVELKDGTILDRYSAPVVAKDGKYYGRIWTFRDITERKQADETLRRSEADLAEGQRVARLGSWRFDVASNKVRWSDELYRVFDVEPATFHGNFEDFLNRVLPDDRPRVLQTNAEIRASGNSFELEYQIRTRAGNLKTILEIGHAKKDASGKIVSLFGTAQDITERKRMELALEESESRYHSLFENMLEGYAYCQTMFEQDQLCDFIYLEVNGAFAALTGLKDVVGKKVSEVIPGFQDTNRELFEIYRRVVLTGKPEKCETYLETLGIWISIAVYSRDQEHFVAVFDNITERKKAENALRDSDEKFRQLADNITDVFWIRSPDLSEVHYVSPAFARIWGRPVANLYAAPQQWSDYVLPEDRERVQAAFAALTGDTRSLDIEYRIVRPDGKIRWVRVRGFQVRDAADKLIRHTGVVTDITERRLIENQLFQSQKMETVGKLAGGFAHEFNSILTAILLQSELLIEDLPTGSPLANSATEISKAAVRAAKMTRQLLAFGRKQFLQLETLDLNLVIAGMENVFRLLMGGDVDMQIVPAPGLRAVKADAGQIEQVITNMVINARDAMPNGGKLTLETANVLLDQEYVSHYPEVEAKAGHYVMLAVSDTGIGMSAEVKNHVFEPFYTTKGVGEGTGLGLSTCYGIVKQSGGHINVYSEPGRGTTFKIYLPQVETQVKIPVQRLDSPDLPRGMETILLVEDDPALREMAATLLRRLGYTVLTAGNGVEALSVNHQRDAGPIDLLFTDVVMPHMSGRELADRMRVLYPLTKILFTSAYTENAIVHQGVLDKGVALLQKPFTPSALAHKLREMLDQPITPKLDQHR